MISAAKLWRRSYGRACVSPAASTARRNARRRHRHRRLAARRDDRFRECGDVNASAPGCRLRASKGDAQSLSESGAQYVARYAVQPIQRLPGTQRPLNGPSWAWPARALGVACSRDRSDRGSGGAVIGREREIAVVSAFLDSIAHGSQALLLQGEAGIGKSTVWFEAVRLAEGACVSCAEGSAGGERGQALLRGARGHRRLCVRRDASGAARATGACAGGHAAARRHGRAG